LTYYGWKMTTSSRGGGCGSLLSLLIILSGGLVACDPCPASCRGCCTAQGKCEAGTSITSCGIDGAACFACLSGSSCTAGKCQAPKVACNSSNCNGCCSEGVCKLGYEKLACGAFGVSCFACGSGQTCDAFKCVASSCGPTNCSGCCLNQTCVRGYGPSSNSACGSNGIGCVVCDDNQTCSSAGKCQ